jgi:hypothetical protein
MEDEDEATSQLTNEPLGIEPLDLTVLSHLQTTSGQHQPLKHFASVVEDLCKQRRLVAEMEAAGIEKDEWPEVTEGLLALAEAYEASS